MSSPIQPHFFMGYGPTILVEVGGGGFKPVPNPCACDHLAQIPCRHVSPHVMPKPMAPEAGETAEAAPEAQRRGDARGGQRTASSAHGDRGDGGANGVRGSLELLGR